MPKVQIKISGEETITIPKTDYLIRNDAWVLASWLIILNVAGWLVYSPFILLEVGTFEMYHKGIQLFIACGSILIFISTTMIFMTIKFTKLATSLPFLYAACLLMGPIMLLTTLMSKTLIIEHPVIVYNTLACGSIITICTVIIFVRFRKYISQNYAG